MTLKLHFMKCPERKISRCILPLNKLFTCLTYADLKKLKVFYREILNILFSYEDKDIGRFSNLH